MVTCWKLPPVLPGLSLFSPALRGRGPSETLGSGPVDFQCRVPIASQCAETQLQAGQTATPSGGRGL